MGSMKYKISDVSGIDKFFNWADPLITRALIAGDVIITLGRESRNNDQNAKLWAMCKDFEPIEFNGMKWKYSAWKCFLLSAFRDEMPCAGLLGEPVSMSLSSSGMSKKEFAELIEFIYSEGSTRGVRWSEKAHSIYEEYA